MKYAKYAPIVFLAIFGLISCLNPLSFDPNFSLKVNVEGQVDIKDVTAASTYIVNMSKSLDFTYVEITQTLNDKLDADKKISAFPNTLDTKGDWKHVKSKYVQASDIEYEVGLTIQPNPKVLDPNLSFKTKKLTDVYATQSKGIYYVWMYRTDDAQYIEDNKKDNPGMSDEEASIVVTSPNNANAARPFPPPKTGDTINLEVNTGSAIDINITIDVLNKISNFIINGGGGNTSQKTPEEESGSVPPVISPQNRTQMGTFVVVNLSRTKGVDYVRFTREDRNGAVATYDTLNGVPLLNAAGSPVGTFAVPMRDRNAIALMQGTYQVIASHSGGTGTNPKRAIMVPSNDPQSVLEHYLYFYKDKHSGKYDLVSKDLYNPDDVDATDVLPPNPNGAYGVGRIMLINKTTKAYLESVTLEAKDRQPPRAENMALPYDKFVKKLPVGPNQSDDVDVIGTPTFPIDGWFLVSVQALTHEGMATVTRLIYLKDSFAEIIITDNDVNIQTVPGARITVQNTVNADNVTFTVNSLKIKDAGTNSLVFSTYISNGQSYTFDVLNSVGLPLMENQTYYADANVTGTKVFSGGPWLDPVSGEYVDDIGVTFSGTITVPISPDGKLYGKYGPASNLKTITINESIAGPIIPLTPPPVPSFTAVSSVTINNGYYVTGDSVRFFAKDGVAKRLDWGVSPDTATYKDQGYWTLGTGDPDANHLYRLTSDGILTVMSTYQYEYLYAAFVVPNGAAPGNRSPVQQTAGNVVGTISYDNTKDFVQVIKLMSPPPDPPPPPYKPRWARVTFQNHDSGASDAVKYLVLYRVKDGVAVGNNATITNGDPANLNFKKMYTYTGTTSYENTDWDKVLPRIPSTGNPVTNVNVMGRYIPGQAEVGGTINDAFTMIDPVGLGAANPIGPPSIKVLNTNNTIASGTFTRTSPNALLVKDSIIIEFDKPLVPDNKSRGTNAKNRWPDTNPNKYTFWLDGNYNWAICWVGLRAESATATKYYRAGWDGNYWFIMSPVLKSPYTDTDFTKPLSIRSEVWKTRYTE